MNKDDLYRRLLAKQLVLNDEIWPALQKNGVNEQTKLRLEFFYAPTSKANAESLASVLREKTDYTVTIETSGILGRKHTVTGTTQETTVSKTVLDQWVDWMVTAGIESNCDFDGWGTEIP